MSEAASVTVRGLGSYLPPLVRTNEAWPAHVVGQWRNKLNSALPRQQDRLYSPCSDGVRRSLEALIALSDDPFQGSVERRVMAPDMKSSDMEAEAARRAIANAGISADKIDLLLAYSMVPDYLTVNPAAIVHKKVGLSEKCFSLHCDGICSSFVSQLSVAEAYIATGRARYALLVQSAAGSRVTRLEEPHSAWLGDAATAVVVGPCRPDAGLQSVVHRTDGEYHRAFVCGVPGKAWYDEGQVVAYSEDPRSSHEMMLGAADRTRLILDEALAEAGRSHADIRFYASHQPSVWFRRVSQETSQLTNANGLDTFPRYGSVGACNIPMQMLDGIAQGSLIDGDLVALSSMSSGMTWSGVILQWGA